MSSLLQEYENRFPGHQFKLSSKGKVQRYYPNNKNVKWKIVCQHNRTPAACRECGGSSFCEHGVMKYRCRNCDGIAICVHNKLKYSCIMCDGVSVCEHKKQRKTCTECDGSAFCEHGKQISICVECDGSGICEHKKIRIRCKDCNGSTFCEHGIEKYRCVDCDGSQICKHGKRKQRCVLCEGSRICIKCKENIMMIDKYCKTCHPDYVPSINNYSKKSCEFMDKIENEIHKNIQHVHLCKKDKEWKGKEFRLPEWRNKPVDGWVKETNTVYEFLGNCYHGHPSLQKKEKFNHYGESHEENYNNTERIFNKVKDLGYNIIYIWECEYDKIKNRDKILSYCIEFDGTLKLKK